MASRRYWNFLNIFIEKHHAKKLYISVSIENVVARKMYSSLGFKEIKEVEYPFLGNTYKEMQMVKEL